ncbi:MAG: 16S rRNA (adenine(1518)-N(6)/adenine(1519)-N(6))-dimethyltransferase RsmA [Desulfobacula sp.]|uniref:16S rRNA (adenine(1518)-N(6)/adenine(1519)-N(6))- dimethyltransferase RsmA n=1 Tax=Desulfobacula sp. TaxID=2593537 RepID=UPI0025BBDDEE|nr:16S rRNA (adenine(1518)-N(6)/adenine(1519)-N(6))-dimethyltransferase RsmA [Desulfobacula sp.]MCD4719667.1 16S rRNA (adenine(1518)-N(6)/adenine(1519)-N(6))-dimethyltransferase RsmA [Desulfobacula sp.]
MIHPGQLLRQRDLYAGKELGQNFLSNPGTAKMIVEKIGISIDSRVLEIGSGLGALTVPIAQIASHVMAVEKDSRLIPLLEQVLDNENIKNVEIINKDIFKVDLKEMAKDKKLVVIGNLPYNISSQILFRLVEERSCIEKAFLMFQKELAKRIIASPGGRDYSRLSAVVQYAADVCFVAQIGPSSFFPKPDVDSTILRFNFFETKGFNQEQEKVLFNVIKAAFSKRRKTLKNSMTGGEFEFKKHFVVHALELAGIDAERRAETLTVEEFKSLARAVWETS